MLAEGSDITEQKRVEEALRESESLYRAIFENTGNASIIIDENTIIQLCNTEWVNLAGYSREEMEGKMSWTNFVVREDLDRMKKYHQARRIDPSAAPMKYEFRYLKRNGEIRHMVNQVGMVPGTKKKHRIAHGHHRAQARGGRPERLASRKGNASQGNPSPREKQHADNGKPPKSPEGRGLQRRGPENIYRDAEPHQGDGAHP
jgi:PAS domain S-box-containing protein